MGGYCAVLPLPIYCFKGAVHLVVSELRLEYSSVARKVQVMGGRHCRRLELWVVQVS